MKIEVKCNSCDIIVLKLKKEVNRQRKKNPNANFYCSLSCSGKQNASHLAGRYPFVAGSPQHAKALEAAKQKNTKYTGVLKFVAETLKRVRRRDPSHNLTVEYLLDLWDGQHERCAISNIPIQIDAIDYVQMASLDRIDSEKGYVQGNVQYVSCSINFAKSTMSDTRVEQFLRLICENYKPRR